MHVSCIWICYACQHLYVVMHVFSWLWLCMYSRSDMHREVIVGSLCHHDAIGMLWCSYVGWDEARDAYHQTEVVALDLKVRVDHPIGLYVWHVGMCLMVVIIIWVTDMIFILLFLWLHAWQMLVDQCSHMHMCWIVMNNSNLLVYELW